MVRFGISVAARRPLRCLSYLSAESISPVALKCKSSQPRCQPMDNMRDIARHALGIFSGLCTYCRTMKMSETKKFTHSLTYKCKKCGRDSVHCNLSSDDPALANSTIQAAIQQAEQWCETPGCGWHGSVAGLQFVHKGLQRWMP